MSNWEWDAEKQRWDPSTELLFHQTRGRALERRWRITAVVLTVLAAVTIGGAQVVDLS